MCITESQIIELNNIIDGINSIKNIEEKKNFLKQNVEDVDFFINVIKKVNKNNLKLKAKPEKKIFKPIKHYEKEEVLNLFKNEGLDKIINNYTKDELSAMYFAVYDCKPLSADKKPRIAHSIMQYIKDAKRMEALLG